MRVKLSLVIITYNEERNLAKTIESCRDIIDEIIIVDSGSTDKTIDIANKFGAKIFYNKFAGFGPQKQLAVNYAKNDWVLCLDADEYLGDELKHKIVQELETPAYAAYELVRCNMFLGRYLKHGAGYPDRSIRLFNRKATNWSDDLVHERVKFCERFGIISGDYYHDSADTLSKYLDKQNKYTETQATTMYLKGKKFKLSRLIISPLWHFIKYFILRRGFLDGVPGFIHILIGSWNTFSKYSKLLEKQNSR